MNSHLVKVKEDGNSQWKAGYEDRIWLSCMKFIFFLNTRNVEISSCQATWVPKVVGAFARRAVKVALIEYCWHSSVTDISDHLALIPAQHKITSWPSLIALCFLQAQKKVEDLTSSLCSIG